MYFSLHYFIIIINMILSIQYLHFTALEALGRSGRGFFSKGACTRRPNTAATGRSVLEAGPKQPPTTHP